MLMKKKLKHLFDRIGLEQPSGNFTFSVMNKIEPDVVRVPSGKGFWVTYKFFLGYLVAALIVVPFAIPAVRYISTFEFQSVYFDINVIREWFEKTINQISYDTISTAIIISVICTIFLGFYALVTFTGMRRKSFYS